MVRALLEGRKTMTRRVGKVRSCVPHKKMALPASVKTPEDALGWAKKCPYGEPGERLWVRETWMPCGYVAYEKVQILYKASNDVRENGVSIEAAGACHWFERPYQEILYFKDDIERMDVEGDRWRPSIHMPRWASRIELEIVSVRVERLQDITEEDAWAEGIGKKGKPLAALANMAICYPGTNIGSLAADDPSLFIFGDDRFLPSDYERVVQTSGRGVYAYLWESINGPGSWAANPWVWRIEFKRIKP